MKLKLIIIIGIMVISLTGLVGIVLRIQPDVVYVRLVKPVYVDRPIYQLVITEKVVEKIIYQDHIVEKPIPQVLTDWQSLEELTQFLKDDQTDKTTFYSLIPSDGFGKPFVDCDDYAMLLRDHATAIGKYISLQAISPTEFVALEGRPWTNNPQDRHMLNSAIVNGVVYYIEPQNDEIWRIGNLD